MKLVVAMKKYSSPQFRRFCPMAELAIPFTKLLNCRNPSDITKSWLKQHFMKR
jgi:hypothetical protein